MFLHPSLECSGDGHPSRLGLLFALLLPWLLLGCSAGSGQSKAFRFSFDDYNNALLWKNFDVVRSYLPPAKRASESARLRAQTERLSLVEVETLEVALDEKGKRATGRMRFSWYSNDDLTVRHGEELQEWAWNGKQWMLVGRTVPTGEKVVPSPFVDRADEDDLGEANSNDEEAKP